MLVLKILKFYFINIPQAKINNILIPKLVWHFLGYGLQVGYQKALQRLFDIDISKAETRSDWLL